MFAVLILGKSEPLNANDALELVLADRTRVLLVRDVTIGSAPDSTVRLDDPAVSRRQARISVGDGEVLLEDAGSSCGTWLDGRRLDGRERLREGSRIRVGDQELVVERHHDEDEAGQTVVSEADAQLLELLDGGRSVPELMREAERREGDAGAARVAPLLSELAERGLLAALAAIAVLIVCGLVAFAYLVIDRYATPFVAARNVGIGALIFFVGCLAVAALHETAHGLVMVSFGRRARRAGLKLLLVFPSALLDTSEAWSGTARRRIAISLAGPLSDLSLGAVFPLCCLALPAGTTRDIFFQVAFAAYVGALFVLIRSSSVTGTGSLSTCCARRACDAVGYAAASVAWSALVACLMVGISLRYEPRLTEVAAKGVAFAALIALWFAFFVPLLVVLAGRGWSALTTRTPFRTRSWRRWGPPTPRCSETAGGRASTSRSRATWCAGLRRSPSRCRSCARWRPATISSGSASGWRAS